MDLSVILKNASNISFSSSTVLHQRTVSLQSLGRINVKNIDDDGLYFPRLSNDIVVPEKLNTQIANDPFSIYDVQTTRASILSKLSDISKNDLFRRSLGIPNHHLLEPFAKLLARWR